MDTKANYTIIGLFVIALTAAMIFIFVWLSGFSHRQSFTTYLVFAQGSVTGLNVDSPVQFNGVRVGTVHKIVLDSVNPQFVKLYLKLESKTPVTQATIATLIPQGITGLVYVGLKAQSAEAPKLKVENNNPYPVIPYEKPLLTQVTEILPELTKNLGDISQKFKKVFSDENVENLSQTLANINKTTGAVAKQSKKISESINSLNVLMNNSAQASEHFKSATLAAQQTAIQFSKTSRKINIIVDKFNQQTLPSAQELLGRLNDTAANLQQVSESLNENPSILIRGRKPPPKGPGE